MGASEGTLFPPTTPATLSAVPDHGSDEGGSPGLSDAGKAMGGHGGPLTIRQKFLLGRRVDINRAGYKEISDLPGISDAVARAVVEERERRGGFRRAEDLLGVRGIKEKRLKKILPFIVLFPNN